jgi:hypothetical protein
MTGVDIAAFEAKVIKLTADGKIPKDVVDGIAKLIAKVNELQTELNRLRTPKPK